VTRLQRQLLFFLFVTVDQCTVRCVSIVVSLKRCNITNGSI